MLVVQFRDAAGLGQGSDKVQHRGRVTLSGGTSGLQIREGLSYSPWWVRLPYSSANLSLDGVCLWRRAEDHASQSAIVE